MSRADDILTVFQGEDGEWRWRRQAQNGQIISVSGEGYKTRQYAIDIASQLNPGLNAEVDGAPTA